MSYAGVVTFNGIPGIPRNAKERDMWVRFNTRLNPIAIDDFLATHERFQVYSNDIGRGWEWLEGEL